MGGFSGRGAVQGGMTGAGIGSRFSPGWGTAIGGGLGALAGGVGGNKKNAPKPPDFQGVARTMGDISKELINAQTVANRPSIYGPTGSMTWQQGPNGEWTGNLALSPEQKALLAQKQGLQGAGMRNVQGLLDNPVDFTGAEAARNRAEDAIYRRMTGRLDPRFAAAADAQSTKLSNMGLSSPLMEANKEAWDTFNRGQNDAYQIAMDQSIMGGGQEMTRQFQQDMAARNQILGEYGATLQGPDYTNINLPGFSEAGVPQVPNLLGAAGADYNAALDKYSINSTQMADLFKQLAGFDWSKAFSF